MTDESKALTVAPVSREIMRLGARKEIKEMARRIQTQAPGGHGLNPEECLTLAQYAYPLGANPLVGEVWLLKGANGKVLGLMPGIRLYRRRADEKDERTSDTRWMEPEIVVDTDERIRFGIPTDAFIAVKVRLYRQSQTKAFSEMVTAMGNAGAPWNDIREIAGSKPYILGIGYLTASEQASLDRAGEKNKMPPFQRALKRAEAHALKQAYSLPFGFVALADDGAEAVPSGAVLEDYIIEGTWKEVAPAPTEERTSEQKAEAADKGSKTLFGEDAGDGIRRSKHSWTPEQFNAVKAVLPPNTPAPHIASVMALMPVSKDAPPADCARWVKAYSAYRYDQGMSIVDAQVAADLAFDKPQ